MKIASMAGAGSGLLSARNNLAFDECQTGHVLKIAAANITCRRSIEIIRNRQTTYENAGNRFNSVEEWVVLQRMCNLVEVTGFAFNDWRNISR